MEEREHKLKTWPDSFEAVLSGRKTHEWRKDDRGYAVNDRLRLEEFVSCKACDGHGRVRDHTDMVECCKKPHGAYTGRWTAVYVTFVTRHPDFGVPKDWIVMSIGQKRVEAPPRDPRVDPRPGDHVESAAGEKAEVLMIRRHVDCDPALGPSPHVESMIDNRSGRRSRSVMSLESWRTTFAAPKPGQEVSSAEGRLSSRKKQRKP